ncbi:MAG: ABC transporter ATP-binding protein [Isosphaerales bacterium]
MQADAYRRARKLLSSHREFLVARVLGFVQSLLLVALLSIIALFVAVMASRGEARFPASRVKDLPAGFRSLTTGREFEGGRQFILFDHTGVFPLISGNLLSNNPVHQLGARVLERITRFLPTLLNNMGALTTLLAMGAACIVLIALVAIWRRGVMALVATEVATALRRQIHRQMYRLGQSSLPTEGIGPVINLWTREVNDIRDGLLADVDITPRIHVLAAGLLVLAILVSPLLTVFLGSLGLLIWLTARVLNRETRQATEAALRDASVQLCLLHEDLGLLRIVRIYGVGDYDRQRFDEHLDRYEEADTRRIVTSGPLNPSTGLLYGAGLTIALGLLGFNVVVIDHISIATMLILLVSLAGLAHPIAEWLRMRKSIRQANRSARGIFEFLERRPELHQNVGAQFLNALKEQIAFENVELESRSGRRLLEGISVEVPAGTRTAIIGPDDDEKLALVCLIPRLIDPRAGRVLIDGHDLRDVTLDSVRLQVATVLQADLVFTDSVLANIGLGDPMKTLPRIIEAAKLAHAHYFIQDLPHGYDTTIGPLGHYLKPDEQFRIALARAYLHDPSILIVEEPNTPIDEDTKHFLDDTLSRMSMGRTLIVLPHRLATLRASDHVIVLHNGRVEEAGSPHQLQTEGKLFRHLLYVEFNEFAGGEIEAGQMDHGEPARKAP